MLQREVYFPWSRRNRYGPAKTPHGPLISIIVAGPHVFQLFYQASGTLALRAPPSMFDSCFALGFCV